MPRILTPKPPKTTERGEREKRGKRRWRERERQGGGGIKRERENNENVWYSSVDRDNTLTFCNLHLVSTKFFIWESV